MMFGPVGEAAKGGSSSPIFDLGLGGLVLLFTWIGYLRNHRPRGLSLWVCIGVTAICAVFIYAGVRGLVASQ